MPQALLWFTEKEDEKIQFYARRWEISKHDTVKRMIKLFTEPEEATPVEAV